MGCDIHAYIETRRRLTKEEEERSHFWNRWDGTKELPFHRDYYIFSELASVRGGGADTFETRGIPEDLSYQVKSEYALYVIDGDEPSEQHEVSREDGERYAKYGGWYDKENKWVNHPDWHSASWANLKELEYIYSQYKNKYDYSCPELEAIMAYMLAYEQCGYDARFVFWFDN